MIWNTIWFKRIKLGTMKRFFKNTYILLKKSIKRFKKDDPIRLAGTTAYFTVFALAPIIIIIVSVLGILLGEEKIQQKLFVEINRMIGENGTQYVKNLVENYQDTQKSIAATIIGFVVFIFTSTTFFTVLQKSLNHVWRIKAKPKRNFLKSLYNRLISFGLILSLGFILLVSLLIDAALSFFNDFLQDNLPNVTLSLLEIGNFLVSFGIVMVVFAMIYKFCPMPISNGE
jgi:membrane protein